MNLLEINFISLDEDDQDKLIWTRNSTNWDYTTKHGSEMVILEQTKGHKAWWWGVLWESNYPLKNNTHLLVGNKKQITDMGKYEEKRIPRDRFSFSV